MRHSYKIDGLTYLLRPITIDDAQTILNIRLEDAERNQYIHPVKNDLKLEKKWLEDYFERKGDYFFAIVNKFTDETEGLIAIYDEDDRRAEWGRWTIKKGSLAATESVYLLYEIAFSKIGLKELYCRTISENSPVVEFHNSSGLKLRTVYKDLVELDGKKYDITEQYITNNDFLKGTKNFLFEKSFSLFKRNMVIYSGGMKFHHIVIACNNIEKDKKNYQLLGYSFESSIFEDTAQGVKGIFATAKNQPCIELLENLAESSTLTPWLENGVKMYHIGYLVKDIKKACHYMEKIKAKLMSPMKESNYFKSKICFFMLQNRILIELIEET